MAVKTIKLKDTEIDAIVDALTEKQVLPYVAQKYKKIIAKLTRPVKRIKVSSAKAKGRNLQKWAVGKIAELLEYKLPENKDDSHIRSREMGQSGVDIVLSKKARQKFPFAVECKNQEHIDLRRFMEQAEANSISLWPLLIVKNKTLKEPLLVMKWEVFARLFAEWKQSDLYKKIGGLD